MTELADDPLIGRVSDVLEPVPRAIEAGEPDPDIVDLLPERLRSAAVLVPLVREPGGWQVLLTRRTDHLRHHAGQIAFPGGRMEAGDGTPERTALRETEEELGIEPERVSIIGALDPMLTITGFRVLPLVGVVRAGFELRLDPSEVDLAFQAPLDFLVDPANRQRQRASFKGRQRRFYVIQYGEHTIWGATAAMLVNLARRLGHD